LKSHDGRDSSQSVIAPATGTGGQFTLSHVAARADGSVTLALTLRAAGAIDVLETANKSGKAALPKPERGRFAFARKHMTLTGAATMTVRVTPNARGKRLIAQARRAHRALFINIWITYTPSGGTPRTQTKLHVRLTR
jgi:hypothetical protein